MSNTTPNPSACIPTTERTAVENYPYGYTQRTTAFYWIESKPGKGFRNVFQTINPKTGKLNAPKRSTYYPVLFKYRDEIGHIKSYAFDLYGVEGINRAAEFIGANPQIFTDSDRKIIAQQIFTHLKASTYGAVAYAGAEVSEVLAILETAVKTAAEIMKTGENLFAQIRVDVAAYEAAKVPGFNPFKVTTYELTGAGLVPVAND